MKDGGAAFPSTREVKIGELTTAGHAGMTLRDYFAGQALAGPCREFASAETAAHEAYRWADAMLAEREKSE